MCKKLIVLVCAVSVLGLADIASALYMPVDIAYPEFIEGDPCFVARFDETAKDGWFPWAATRWKDLWRHDMVWAGTNTVGNDPLPEGILGTGINARLETVIQEGHSRLWVTGMVWTEDGGAATGHPKFDEIANSFMTVYQLDGYDLRMLLTGIPAGTYFLETYHNDPCSDPDWGIHVNLASVKITGTGLAQAVYAYDVVVQHVMSDDELVPNVMSFTTDGSGDVWVEFVRGTGGRPLLNAFVLHTGKGPASEPIPAHLAEDVCADDLLCWTAGPFAAEHDVYLGTNLEDVNNATTSSPEYKETLSVGTECYQPTGLELDTTYYWRVDEVNDPCVWKGDVWQYTTNDGNAFAPDPPDEETRVPLDYALSWQAGCLASAHDVYFGTSLEAVTDATTSSHPDVQYERVTMPTISWDPPGDLEYATAYYWRIDAVDGPTIWKGAVWTFKSRWEVDDPTLLVWYKFDEEPPSTDVIDWSGHEYHSSVGVGAANSLDPIGGRFGGCRTLHGAIHVPPQSVSTITSATTISAWVKDVENTESNILFDATGGVGVRVRAFVPRTPLDDQEVYWRAGIEPNDVLTWDIDGLNLGTLEGWHHYLFMKDENAGTMSIYHDARRVAYLDTGLDDNLATLLYNEPEIGGLVAGSDPFRGKIDDFRMYDRVLTEPEIFELYRGGDVGGAWFPTPPDRAINIDRGVTLNWRAGDYAMFHDVFMGTSFDDVNDATTSSGVYKDRLAVDVNYYQPPSLLDLATTYYWRIDEVNTVDPNTWKGKVWEFTVANYLIVDDMEAYNQTDNRIYDTWEDGYANETGSELDLGFDPIHDGEKSMIYVYDNADPRGWDFDYYSEIEVDVLHPNLKIGSRNWTQADVKILTLFFYGLADNDANATEQMYVGLADTRGSGSYAQVDYGYYGGDMDDIKEEEWHQWDVALPDFTDLMLTAVEKIYIGIGIRGNPNPGGTPGGNGVVYFDDIRLYLPKCVPWRLKPEADFTDDCKVDLADVGEMADEWLRTDAVFDEYTDPGTTGLVGWWKLDEGSGDIANDSSASGTHDGTISGLYSWVSGYDGSAVEFSDGRVLVPDAAELRPETAVSTSAWIYYSKKQDNTNRVVVKGANDKETFLMQLGGGDDFSFYVRDVNDNMFGAGSSDVWRDEWIHIAGTFDGDSNTVGCYVNGELANSNEDANFVTEGMTLSQDTSDLAIGNRSDANDRNFEGTIDDVRVYNRALSAAEVAWLASDGTGYVPLRSAVNIYDEELQGDKAVNFRDLAKLMLSWGEEKFWPE